MPVAAVPHRGPAQGGPRHEGHADEDMLGRDNPTGRLDVAETGLDHQQRAVLRNQVGDALDGDPGGKGLDHQQDQVAFLDRGSVADRRHRHHGHRIGVVLAMGHHADAVLLHGPDHLTDRYRSRVISLFPFARKEPKSLPIAPPPTITIFIVTPLVISLGPLYPNRLSQLFRPLSYCILTGMEKQMADCRLAADSPPTAILFPVFCRFSPGNGEKHLWIFLLVSRYCLHIRLIIMSRGYTIHAAMMMQPAGQIK